MADTLTDEELAERRLILDEVEGSDKLQGRAIDFVADQRVRLEKYGAATRISPAQWKWLRDIYEQVTGL